MGPNQKRIIVESLRPGRLVIGVIQADQCVPEERNKLAASLLQFRGGCLRFQKLGDISPHFQVGVVVVISSSRKLGSLALGKDRARHLKFGELFGERQQVIVRWISARRCTQAIAERQ